MVVGWGRGKGGGIGGGREGGRVREGNVPAGSSFSFGVHSPFEMAGIIPPPRIGTRGGEVCNKEKSATPRRNIFFDLDERLITLYELTLFWYFIRFGVCNMYNKLLPYFISNVRPLLYDTSNARYFLGLSNKHHMNNGYI